MSQQWQKWYDGLSNHTKQYLKEYRCYNDRDLITACMVGGFVGFMMGVLS